MAGHKRRALTTDDLLRMQEEPGRKRLKRDLDSDSDVEDQASDVEQSSIASSSSSSSHSGSGGDGSDDDERAEHPFASSFDISWIPDETSSRVSARKALVAPRNEPPIISPTRPSTFASLGITSTLFNALSKMSIRVPTEVQAACIPPLLEGEYLTYPGCHQHLSDTGRFQGRDCIGNAKTGSGKTIAFALPILQKLAVDPYGIFALVLTPTRYASST